MIESQTRSARLDDVRGDTFSLFCQFAYTGDFETTSCTLEEVGGEQPGST